MKEQVRTYIREHGLLKDGGRVVLGLSGGADSVCLLHLLAEMGYEVVAAHCNFHLRGNESDRDERFVRDLCRTMGIKLLVRDFDTKADADRQGISIEMAARDLRYAWFEEVRLAEQAEAIAVAHHRNDQAETLLLNLFRGTGVRGLGGMKPKNGWVIRPLLGVSRREIETYMTGHGYAYVTDSTNSDTTIRRNAVRALLADRTDKEIEHLSHTADLMQGYDALLQALLNGTEIDAAGQSVLLYELLQPYGFNATQAENIAAALPSSGKRFKAPDYTAFVDHGELHIVSKANEAKLAPETNRCKSERFDADRLPERMMLRHWQTGDSFYPLANKGRAVRKKLQDFFSDLKLDVEEKHRVWLLCDADQPEEIVWVVGYRISDKYKITPITRRIAELSVENGELKMNNICCTSES